jgi:hypothetical protein
MTNTDQYIETGGNAALAALFLDYHSTHRADGAHRLHDGTAWFRDPDYAGPCEAINPDQINELTDAIQDFIANVISSILDAGSERDAVNENDDLHAAIWAELKGWVSPTKGDMR